jgi:hypothetical protein
MSNKPLKPVAINIDKVGHDKLKTKKYKNGQESKQARMTYDKVEFRIQTPLAEVPFGLTKGEELDKEGKPVKNSTKPIKYSLDFNVMGPPAGTVDLDEFKKAMKKLDTKTIDYIVSQSELWWGKKGTAENIAEYVYSSVIKQDKKGEYPDRFKIKLPLFEGKPKFKVYDENNKIVEWVKSEEVDGKEVVTLEWEKWAQPHMKIEAIVECEGLWEVNKKVFCTFKALQIRVHPPETLPECAFDDGPVKAKTEAKTEEGEEDLKVEDDDEDAEDAEEDAEEDAD